MQEAHYQEKHHCFAMEVKVKRHLDEVCNTQMLAADACLKFDNSSDIFFDIPTAQAKHTCVAYLLRWRHNSDFKLPIGRIIWLSLLYVC